MEKREDHRFVPVRRGLQFVDLYEDRLGRIPHIKPVADLRDYAAMIEQFALTQAEGKSTGPATTILLKERRQDIMDVYVNPVLTLIEVSRSSNEPGDWMDVTKPDPDLALDTFVAQLRVLSNYVKQREEQFALWLNLPPGFDAAIDTLEQTRADRWQLEGRSAGATTGVKELLARAREAIDVIDAALRAEVKDKALMAEWKAAIKVPKAPTRAKAPEQIAEKTATEAVCELPATIVPETHRLSAPSSPETALASIVQPERRAIHATATVRLSPGDPNADSLPSKIAAQLRKLAARVRSSEDDQKPG